MSMKKAIISRGFSFEISQHKVFSINLLAFFIYKYNCKISIYTEAKEPGEAR